jgi:signal transduction histidine kinase
MKTHWLATTRHLLLVVAFCCVIAVLTTSIWPNHSYWIQLGHALSIGLVTWAVIEFGRYLVPQRHCHPGSDDDGHGWPRGWRGTALAATGIGAGFLVGNPLGAWLMGTSGYRSTRDEQIGLLITIAAGAVASFYFHMRGRAAALEARRAAAERDASQARLMLLQSQLEPHMLFNTLANLRALIAVDAAAAQQMLDRLNDYLRATLGASRATAHPLAAEFERLADYLALMAIRMGPRLAYALHLPDELRALPMPPLLLQPVVENAIQHGLEPRVQGGRIDVSAAREGGALVLTVQDSGVGFDTDAPARPGRFGMAQVTERVQSAYGGRGAVELQSQPGAGTTVRIVLPLAPAH